MKRQSLIFAFFVLFLGTFSVTNVAGDPIIPEEFVVEPDPENPIQGTWITSMLGSNFIHIIKGMRGELYINKYREPNISVL